MILTKMQWHFCSWQKLYANYIVGMDFRRIVVQFRWGISYIAIILMNIIKNLGRLFGSGIYKYLPPGYQHRLLQISNKTGNKIVHYFMNAQKASHRDDSSIVSSEQVQKRMDIAKEQQ